MNQKVGNADAGTLDRLSNLLSGMTTNANVREAVKNYFLWWKQTNDCVGAVDAAGDYLDTPDEVDEFGLILNELNTVDF